MSRKFIIEFEIEPRFDQTYIYEFKFLGVSKTHLRSAMEKMILDFKENLNESNLISAVGYELLGKEELLEYSCTKKDLLIMWKNLDNDEEEWLE